MVPVQTNEEKFSSAVEGPNRIESDSADPHSSRYVSLWIHLGARFFSSLCGSRRFNGNDYPQSAAVARPHRATHLPIDYRPSGVSIQNRYRSSISTTRVDGFLHIYFLTEIVIYYPVKWDIRVEIFDAIRSLYFHGLLLIATKTFTSTTSDKMRTNDSVSSRRVLNNKYSPEDQEVTWTERVSITSVRVVADTPRCKKGSGERSGQRGAA
ncbi:hypothetical protein J6590_021581 [Homalodisca vitripennis]|nr:hypothetical protein J6590_021581 [Homalodisca vitripennis]